jgi:hypothetical protein
MLQERQSEFDAIRGELQRAMERNAEQLEAARRQLEQARQQNAEVRREAEQVLQEALRERQRIVRDQLERAPPAPLLGGPGVNGSAPFSNGGRMFMRGDSAPWVQGQLGDVFLPPVISGAPNGLDFAAGGQRFVAGVELSNLNPSLARYFEVDTGVLVTAVTPGSPGAVAGLLPGDVILEVHGETVTTIQEVRRAMNRRPPARVIDPGGADAARGGREPIPLRVVREGAAIALTIPR